MPLTNAGKSALADYLVAQAPNVALYTVSPDATGGGTEVTGGSYARQTLTAGAAVNGVGTSTAAVSFPGMPAATVVAAGLLKSDGTILAYGAISPSAVVASGDTFQFNTGDVDWTIV